MSDIAFRLMMESGVLRPGDREIRRGIDSHATRQVSDVLNHAVEVLFGPELNLEQEKMSKAVSHCTKPTPSQPVASWFSLKGILRRLGSPNQMKTNGSGPKVPT